MANRKRTIEVRQEPGHGQWWTWSVLLRSPDKAHGGGSAEGTIQHRTKVSAIDATETAKKRRT